MLFESKKFESWLEEIKKERIDNLLEVKEMVAIFKEEAKEQRFYKVEGYNPFKNIDKETKSYADYIRKEYKYIHIIPEMKHCSCWKTTKKIKKYKEDDLVYITEFINIDGEEYENLLYCTSNNIWVNQDLKKEYNGLASYLSTKEHTITEANLIDGRDEEWIIKKAEKERVALKKSLEAKVEKICGKEIVEVMETYDGLFLKGSNGRTTHLWAISAGGYNVQCLHTRLLCKEVK